VTVQRLFSMFPRGLPGLALVLLRFSVAISLLLEQYRHRQALSGWIQGAAILLSAALCAGYLTPITALIAAVFHGLIWSVFVSAARSSQPSSLSIRWHWPSSAPVRTQLTPTASGAASSYFRRPDFRIRARPVSLRLLQALSIVAVRCIP
jgi:hypothetical protein